MFFFISPQNNYAYLFFNQLSSFKANLRIASLFAKKRRIYFLLLSIVESKLEEGSKENIFGYSYVNLKFAQLIGWMMKKKIRQVCTLLPRIFNPFNQSYILFAD